MTDYIAKEFFTYTASLSALAAAATNSDQINIEADSDFMINKIAFTVFDDAGAAVAIPNLTVQFTNSASGRTLFDEPQAISTIAGDGKLPFVPPVAYLLRAKSTFTATFSNRGGDNYENIAIAFLGTKMYLR